MSKFKLHNRVILSKKGQKEIGVKYASRVGTIVGFSREGYPRVLWDELKISQVVHPSLIELKWKKRYVNEDEDDDDEDEDISSLPFAGHGGGSFGSSGFGGGSTGGGGAGR